MKVNRDGTFTVVADGLNQPTSLEFIGNTAYVVTLTGEIWKIDNVSGPPYGVRVETPGLDTCVGGSTARPHRGRSTRHQAIASPPAAFSEAPYFAQ